MSGRISCQVLVSFCFTFYLKFFILAIVAGLYWYLTDVLIFISLKLIMLKTFSCTYFPICVSSLWRVSFAHYLTEIFVFLFLYLDKFFFNRLEIQILCHMICKYFLLLCISFVFYPLNRIFHRTEVFHFDEIIYQIFLQQSSVRTILRRLCLTLCNKNFS